MFIDIYICKVIDSWKGLAAKAKEDLMVGLNGVEGIYHEMTQPALSTCPQRKQEQFFFRSLFEMRHDGHPVSR